MFVWFIVYTHRVSVSFLSELPIVFLRNYRQFKNKNLNSFNVFKKKRTNQNIICFIYICNYFSSSWVKRNSQEKIIDFFGKPIIVRAIEHCLNGGIETVYVS